MPTLTREQINLLAEFLEAAAQDPNHEARGELDKITRQHLGRPLDELTASPPGRATAIGRGGLEGLTFATDDEIYGALDEKARNRYRVMSRWAAERYPTTSLTSNIGGAIAGAIPPVMAATKLPAAIGLGAKGAGAVGRLAARMGRGADTGLGRAAVGAGVGAVEEAGRGYGGGISQDERISGAGVGALLGGGFGAFAPLVGSTVAKGARGAVRRAANLTGSDRLAQAFGLPGRSPGLSGRTTEVLTEAANNLKRTEITNPVERLRALHGGAELDPALHGGAVLGDLGGDFRTLTEAAVRQPLDSSQQLHQQLGARADMARPRIDRALTQLTTSPQAIKQLEQRIAGRRLSAKDLYEESLDAPGPSGPVGPAGPGTPPAGPAAPRPRRRPGGAPTGAAGRGAAAPINDPGYLASLDADARAAGPVAATGNSATKGPIFGVEDGTYYGAEEAAAAGETGGSALLGGQTPTRTTAAPTPALADPASVSEVSGERVFNYAMDIKPGQITPNQFAHFIFRTGLGSDKARQNLAELAERNKIKSFGAGAMYAIDDISKELRRKRSLTFEQKRDALLSEMRKDPRLTEYMDTLLGPGVGTTPAAATPAAPTPAATAPEAFTLKPTLAERIDDIPGGRPTPEEFAHLLVGPNVDTKIAMKNLMDIQRTLGFVPGGTQLDALHKLAINIRRRTSLSPEQKREMLLSQIESKPQLNPYMAKVIKPDATDAPVPPAVKEVRHSPEDFAKSIVGEGVIAQTARENIMAGARDAGHQLSRTELEAINEIGKRIRQRKRLPLVDKQRMLLSEMENHPALGEFMKGVVRGPTGTPTTGSALFDTPTGTLTVGGTPTISGGGTAFDEFTNMVVQPNTSAKIAREAFKKLAKEHGIPVSPHMLKRLDHTGNSIRNRHTSPIDARRDSLILNLKNDPAFRRFVEATAGTADPPTPYFKPNPVGSVLFGSGDNVRATLTAGGDNARNLMTADEFDTLLFDTTRTPREVTDILMERATRRGHIDDAEGRRTITELVEAIREEGEEVGKRVLSIPRTPLNDLKENITNPEVTLAEAARGEGRLFGGSGAPTATFTAGGAPPPPPAGAAAPPTDAPGGLPVGGLLAQLNRIAGTETGPVASAIHQMKSALLQRKGEGTTVPARMLHNMLQDVNDAARSAEKNGKNAQALRFGKVADEIRKPLLTIKDYRQASDQFAEASALEDIREVGRGVLKTDPQDTIGRLETLTRAGSDAKTAGFADQSRTAVQAGVRDAIEGVLSTVPAHKPLTNALNKLSTPRSAEGIGAALSPNEANTFASALSRELAFGETAQASAKGHRSGAAARARGLATLPDTPLPWFIKLPMFAGNLAFGRQRIAGQEARNLSAGRHDTSVSGGKLPIAKVPEGPFSRFHEGILTGGQVRTINELSNALGRTNEDAVVLLQDLIARSGRVPASFAGARRTGILGAQGIGAGINAQQQGTYR